MITSEDQLYEKAAHMGIKLNDIVNKDRLPNYTRQGGYIINLQDSMTSGGDMNSGTHWCGIWIEGNHAAYFDPFGLSPPANVQYFTQRYDPIYSIQQVQNEKSGWCGYYTLMFLWFMSHRKKYNVRRRLDEFLKLWSQNPLENLTRLKGYFREIK